MERKRMFTLSEAIDLLDQLENSPDALDVHVDKEHGVDFFEAAKIYIQPPDNSNNDENSDIDSGDENEPTGDASLLSGNQLLGAAVVDINGPSGRVILEDEYAEQDQEGKSEMPDIPQPMAKKRRKSTRLNIQTSGDILICLLAKRLPGRCLLQVWILHILQQHCLKCFSLMTFCITYVMNHLSMHYQRVSTIFLLTLRP